MRSSRLLLVALAGAAIFACDEGTIGPGTSEYHAGTLGTGGFAYDCDDSVVCGRANAAKEFPKFVAMGSSFSVRYIAADPNDQDASNVVTLKTVGDDVLSVSPTGGFAALSPGWSTIVAYDASGKIVEFTPLAVAKPDSLSVYDNASQQVDSFGAATVSLNPPVQAVSLQKGEARLLNAVAAAKSRPLAGSLHCDWTSSNPVVASIDFDLMQRVNVVAKERGTTTISVSSGELSASIDLVVE